MADRSPLDYQPWRKRLELGLHITDKLGPTWVTLAGDDFLACLELAIGLTFELAEDWAAIYCHCARVGRPLTKLEIAAGLELDPATVTRCLERLQAERLVEQADHPGLYRLRQRTP